MLNLDSDFKRLFPKLDFTLKAFQKEVISNVVEKDSTLCIMPTGGGKSAIYWMAAVELNGICIVISPLTALIAEQAQKIEEQGYETLEIHGGIDSMKQIQNKFDLERLYLDHPEYRSVIGSDGKDKRFRNNIFDKIPAFTETQQNSTDIATIGVIKNKRVWRYISRSFVDVEHENLAKWKVLVARVNGSGALGEVLSTPIIIGPNQAYTQTFIGIGAFDTKNNAENCFKYVKSKFCRALLGVLKITQDNNREAWRMIPLQDFTSASDIDWSKSIPEIDQQLYAKYGLDAEEIDFIETHVKPMT